MNVTLNGDSLKLEVDTSLLTLVKIKELQSERIVIEYNYNILSKEEWENTILKENDLIEILSFVVGG